MRVYKILTTPQLEALRAEGSTLGAPIDLRDGYVHLSAEDQVAGTLALHFHGQSGLWVLGVDADALGDGDEEAEAETESVGAADADADADTEIETVAVPEGDRQPPPTPAPMHTEPRSPRWPWKPNVGT